VSLLLIVIIVILLIGVLPSWPYAAGWGYYPSWVMGIVLIVLIVLLLTGRL
jgi:hypothetical protein